MLRSVLLALVAFPVAASAQAPQFAPPVQNPFGLMRSGLGVRSIPAVADLDADGDADLISGDFGGDVFYYQNTAGPNATPVFAASVTLPFGYASPGLFLSSSPALGDLDGDGDTDLMVVFEDGTFRYSENTAGAGQTVAFAAGRLNPFGLATGARFLTVSLVDLDGDADTDILGGDGAGAFTYYANTAGPNATPAFAAPISNPFGLQALPNTNTPAAVDLDGDGDVDVLAAGRTAFFYFENTAGPNATPVYATGVGNPFGLMPGSNSPAPAVADLDTDGDLDVLAGESVGNFYYFQNVRTVSSEAAPEARIALGVPVPNPANSRSTVAISVAQAQTLRVDVVDVLGRIVLSERLDVAAGTTEVRLDLAALAPGAYVVRASGQSRRLTVAR